KVPGHETLRKVLYETFMETSLPALLRYEDRNSMAHSIESRVPFLTPALVNFLFALPEEYIISSDGTSKAIFRIAMRGIVPDPVLDRRDKIGFQTPEKAWLVTLRPWVEKELQSEVARQIPVLDQKMIEQEWKAVLNGTKSFDFRIWRWVNLVKWADCFAVSFGR
ncbi:MAG: asparagine synthetase B, partial [candidate division Zixibacteria bacterium]|nr:asparagine synthetase B [candidate division Zixibacteria bacterium]